MKPIRLCLCLGLVLACALAPAADAAPSRAAEIAPIADGVYLLPGRFEPGRQPDGNSVLLQGDGALLLIDSGRHAEHTTALIDWADAHGQPIAAVVNTHWHLDHIGGNVLLRRLPVPPRFYASAAVNEAIAGVMPRNARDLQALLADPATADGLRAMVRIDLQLLEQRALLAPDVVLQGPPREMDLLGRPLLVGVERDAVSGGDVWVLDRRSRVLVVGDFVTLPVPFFDTACVPGWRAALARIEALPFDRVVPGHGPVMSRADYVRYRRAFEALVDCAAGDRAAAACSAAWIDDLGPLLPVASQARAHAMVAGYFEQRLRAAPPGRDRYCTAAPAPSASRPG